MKVNEIVTEYANRIHRLVTDGDPTYEQIEDIVSEAVRRGRNEDPAGRPLWPLNLFNLVAILRRRGWLHVRLRGQPATRYARGLNIVEHHDGEIVTVMVRMRTPDEQLIAFDVATTRSDLSTDLGEE